MKIFVRYFFVVLGIVVMLGTYTAAVYAVKDQPHLDTSTVFLFRLACADDVGQLLALQSQIDQHPVDSTKLVILPERFRRDSLAKNISNARLFVVQENDAIIAFVKLHIIQPDDRQDILENEIRCEGEHAKLSHHSCGGEEFSPDDSTVFLYLGSEYTSHEFRGKHLGTRLMAYAVDCLLGDIRNLNSPKIAMVYGKAKSETADKPSYDATLPKRAFAYLLEKLFGIENVNHTTIATSVYAARMPVLVFDSARGIIDARDGEPCSDHGCVLSYCLKNVI